MSRIFQLRLAGTLLLAATGLFGQTAPPAQTALVNQYCITCHSEKLKTAGVDLENRDYSHVAEDAEVWEKVVRKLRAGEMPPVGLPRPGKASIDKLATWLENTLDTSAVTNPNPGRTMIHRLNRTEYANAIKDVLNLDVDASELLPPDDSADGFDNIAQMLTISPAESSGGSSSEASTSRFSTSLIEIGRASCRERV